ISWAQKTPIQVIFVTSKKNNLSLFEKYISNKSNNENFFRIDINEYFIWESSISKLKQNKDLFLITACLNNNIEMYNKLNPYKSFLENFDEDEFLYILEKRNKEILNQAFQSSNVYNLILSKIEYKALTIKEIAINTEMSSNILIPYLNNLLKNKLIFRFKDINSKNYLYVLSDPFQVFYYTYLSVSQLSIQKKINQDDLIPMVKEYYKKMVIYKMYNNLISFMDNEKIKIKKNETEGPDFIIQLSEWNEYIFVIYNKHDTNNDLEHLNKLLIYVIRQDISKNDRIIFVSNKKFPDEFYQKIQGFGNIICKFIETEI
ncbi:MAG: hypothetical protein ACRCXZ_02635, partial [Patescibacteria group bacterium]